MSEHEDTRVAIARTKCAVNDTIKGLNTLIDIMKLIQNPDIKEEVFGIWSTAMYAIEMLEFRRGRLSEKENTNG